MKSIAHCVGQSSLALLVSLSAVATGAEEMDPLPGLYACRGSNADGSVYEGRVEIAARKGVYNLTWNVGEQTYVGVALREGDVLSVAWGIPGEGGTAIGVVAYKIEKGGSLSGRWTVLGGDNPVLKESLRKIPDA